MLMHHLVAWWSTGRGATVRELVILTGKTGHADMMVTDVCLGGKDLRTAYATLPLAGTLVPFEWPRTGLPLPYLDRP
jgi:hypothetical protein